MQSYLPVIEARVAEYVANLGNEVYLGKDLIEFCLQLFAELFCGDKLTDEEVQMFKDYNAGLFALTTFEPAYVKADQARIQLTQNMKERFLQVKAAGLLEEPGFLFFKKMDEAVEETGEKWSDDRIGFATYTFVWGAYIECASLMANAVVGIRDRPDIAEKVVKESVAAGVLDTWGSAETVSSRFQKWQMPYTLGVLREALRSEPPGGGGFRATKAPVKIGGFDIPVGSVVTADPRFG